MAKPTINAVLTYTDEQIAALTAEEIAWLDYGIQYFDPQVAGIQITPRYHEVMGQLEARAAQPKAAQPKTARQPAYPTGRKLNCGHIVYESADVMSASLGSSCPDCYDRMSD